MDISVAGANGRERFVCQGLSKSPEAEMGFVAILSAGFDRQLLVKGSTVSSVLQGGQENQLEIELYTI